MTNHNYIQDFESVDASNGKFLTLFNKHQVVQHIFNQLKFMNSKLILLYLIIVAYAANGWIRVPVAKQAGDGKNMMFGVCDRRILSDKTVQEKNCMFDMKPGYRNFYHSGVSIHTYGSLYEAKFGFRSE